MESVRLSEMDSKSSFEHLINDAICQNQDTLHRFLEDVLFFRVRKRGHGRHSMSTHWLGCAMGVSGPGLVRPELDGIAPEGGQEET